MAFIKETSFGAGTGESNSLENATLLVRKEGDESESFDADVGFGSIAINSSADASLDPIKAVSGTIDPRIKFLSFSSLLTLHSCPRKYQLYKLRTDKATAPDEQGITFAFGHVVGEGIQLAFQGLSYRAILFRMFCMWDVDLYSRDEKAKKSFAEAAFAVRKFIELRKAGFLNEYELVYLDQSRPACELGFAVNIFDGFIYRGFVDAVLRNKITGEIIILECKTTKNAQTNPAQFKNSGQALGYSIVLDALFPGLSSYSVLYLVYSTNTLEYTPLPFPKSFESRAEWIRSLVFDVEDIIRYEDAGIYSRRGESCYSFFRECEYLSSCGYSTAYLATGMHQTQEEIDKDMKRYEHKFNLVDLINNQISRNTGVIS